MSEQISPSVTIIGSRGYPSYYGGFETLVRKLAPYLAEHGWRVTVYGREQLAGDRRDEAHPGVKTTVTWGMDSKSLSTLTYGLSASVDAARRKPDVALVLNVANGFYLPMLKLRGVPTLVNVDGIEWERDKWGRAARALFRAGARCTAAAADALILDSAAIAQQWSRDFGRSGYFIPYGGEQLDDVTPPLGLARRGYVLMVARLVPENSVGAFLEAAREISRRWPVVVVGSSGYGGAFEQELTDLTSEQQDIRWLGHVSDDNLLFALWNNAGAYFHGHSVGGTNPALVQAMHCGAPTVARETVYNREVLDECGLYVEPVAAGITSRIFQLMDNSEQQEKLARLARDRAARTYGWNSVMESYRLALDDVQANCRRVRWSHV
ncbi:DUF1972 domain-containing protein [Pseudonocardia kunmingensis]|uniref:Glycosyltransferase involved in cell wall biosynthesis n=1 Tax=Pseudonocardia kunmingensis TaxID=630975 RepID=A0A543DZT3_9PSEU|nr:DUF1972 domain-containing protein [Pseudonocardia kunmingensis]TQM14794.1 glycosyltransferase involved in cell wall biosynthesis [Pseudonocardia kunmingensis]